MPTIDCTGVSIHYESHGPDKAPPILLSHGYGATSRMWDGQVAAFAERWRLILWDMRGHGQSGDPRDPAAYSQALSVGDMMAVGCCSRWGKRCGRSVFGGRPPGGGGSDMPGAGRRCIGDIQA